MERTNKPNLSTQVQRKITRAIADKDTPEKKEYDGDFGTVISTGSTLLDLAISGGRIRGGGLPGGVLVEIFGPSGTGKTVLLSEIAGSIQRQKGEILFHDPEARLNKQFAAMFGFNLDEGNYYRPNTVPEVFTAVRNWSPKGQGLIHGIMADSLAALSTDLEMEGKDGDKMGMRRAKEFSEELRKTCRILSQENYLMVCSNQVRVNVDAGQWGQKYTTPGGESVAFYSSCRLRTQLFKKETKEKTFRGKTVKRVIGVQIEVEVYKNSIWKPHHTAPVTIIFDYGIDDIRQNLQYIKQFSNKSVYTIGGNSLGNRMDEAIAKIESDRREAELKEEVISLWERIELQFQSNRKTKER